MTGARHVYPRCKDELCWEVQGLSWAKQECLYNRSKYEGSFVFVESNISSGWVEVNLVWRSISGLQDKLRRQYPCRIDDEWNAEQGHYKHQLLESSPWNPRLQERTSKPSSSRSTRRSLKGLQRNQKRGKPTKRTWQRRES